MQHVMPAQHRRQGIVIADLFFILFQYIVCHSSPYCLIVFVTLLPSQRLLCHVKCIQHYIQIQHFVLLQSQCTDCFVFPWNITNISNLNNIFVISSPALHSLINEVIFVQSRSSFIGFIFISSLFRQEIR